MILRWPRLPLQRGTAECLSVSNGRLLLCFGMTVLLPAVVILQKLLSRYLKKIENVLKNWQLVAFILI